VTQLLGKRYLSVAEYAALKGLKPDTVRWRLEHGRLRGRKNGKGSRWQIPAGEATK
jgi:DNA-directed RNA polymerase specialized sigma24 family protein